MPDSISGLFGALESEIRWSKLFLVPKKQNQHTINTNQYNIKQDCSSEVRWFRMGINNLNTQPIHLLPLSHPSPLHKLNFKPARKKKKLAWLPVIPELIFIRKHSMLKKGSSMHSYPVVSWHWPVMAAPCRRSWTCVCVGSSAPLWDNMLPGSVLILWAMSMADSPLVACHIVSKKQQTGLKQINKHTHTCLSKCWLSRSLPTKEVKLYLINKNRSCSVHFMPLLYV